MLGSAYEFFTKQADIAANIFKGLSQKKTKIKSVSHLKEKGVPNLRGGRKYISSPRHETYVRMNTMKKYLARQECSKLGFQLLDYFDPTPKSEILQAFYHALATSGSQM